MTGTPIPILIIILLVLFVIMGIGIPVALQILKMASWLNLLCNFVGGHLRPLMWFPSFLSHWRFDVTRRTVQHRSFQSNSDPFKGMYQVNPKHHALVIRESPLISLMLVILQSSNAYGSENVCKSVQL